MTSRIRWGPFPQAPLAPTEVKRLAANIRCATDRMRELLAQLCWCAQWKQVNISDLQHPPYYRGGVGGGPADRGIAGVRIVNEAPSASSY